ncbi:hypothetical protein [Rubritalea tangerina]|uniref:Uncharacterized protein n=1 Tax=Rubritalea tangerina TaxID=430798 RepID=A0ABW4ZCN7_9BACT
MRIAFSLIGFILFSLLSYSLAEHIHSTSSSRNITLIWMAASSSLAIFSLTSALFILPNKAFWIAAGSLITLSLVRIFAFPYSNDALLPSVENLASYEPGYFLAMLLWLLILARVNAKDVMC